jgi:hypothetical protein
MGKSAKRLAVADRGNWMRFAWTATCDSGDWLSNNLVAVADEVIAYPTSHLPIELCYLLSVESGSAQVQFAVGFKFQGKTGHVVVDAEDALIAALKVKMQRPEALIAYVRQQNKRGDTRHPMRRLSSGTP